MNDQRRHWPAFGLLVGILVGALLIAVLTVLVQTWTLAGAIREAQKGTIGTLSTSSRTLERITACSTPGRRCYERSQRHVALLKSDLTRASAAAAACADKPGQQSADQVYACVVRRLAKQAHR